MKKGYTSLYLFFGIFAAVGIGATYFFVSHIFESISAFSWEKVPAEVISIHSGKRRSSNGDGRTAYISGSFNFSYQGRQYQGADIGLRNEGGFGFVFDARAKDIREKRNSGQQIFAYVNPDNPSQAVLFPGVVWDYLLFLGIFIVTFGGFGLGGIYWIKYSKKKARREEQLKNQYPEEPWRWSEGWNKEYISSDAKGAVYALWGFAILWNAVTFPLILILPEELSKGNYPALLALLFPLAGIWLIVKARNISAQNKEYGGSRLYLSTLPGVIGGKLEGRVVFFKPLVFEGPVRLSLKSTKIVGYGKHRSTVTLWEDSRKQIHGSPVTEIKVDFSIPYSCEQSNGKDNVTWELSLKAKVDGVDLAQDFTVPVFKTRDSNEDLKEIDVAREIASEDAESMLSSRKIKIEKLGDELIITVPPWIKYTPGLTKFLVIISSTSAIGIALMIFFGAPIIVTVALAIVEVFFIFAVINAFTKLQALKICDRQLEVSASGIFGAKRNRIYKMDDIENFTYRVTGQFSTGKGVASTYAIDANLKSAPQQKSTIVSGIVGKEDAKALVAVIIGEKQDNFSL